MKNAILWASVGVLAMAVSAVRAEEENKPRAQVRTGVVGKTDGKSLTIVMRGDGGESSETVALEAGTKIVLESDENEQVPGEGGKAVSRPKLKDIKAGDLKEGQKVTVTFTADKKATQVRVLRQRGKNEKEGENNNGAKGDGGEKKGAKDGEGEKKGPRDGEIGGRIAGKVKGIDAKAGTITIAGKQKEDGTVTPDLTLSLAKDAKISVNGEKKGLDGIQAGAMALLVLDKDKKVSEIAVGKKREKDGEKPPVKKPDGDKPPVKKPEGDKPGEKKPEGDKPNVKKPEGDKPAEKKPEGDKPGVKKPEGDRPNVKKPEGDKPAEKKPEGDKPAVKKPEGDKPNVKKPEGDKK